MHPRVAVRALDKAAGYRGGQQLHARMQSPPSVPDRGPWTVQTASNGRACVSSEDFNHDVLLNVGGDFEDENARREYAEYLADVLTKGCRQQQCLQSVGGSSHLIGEFLSGAARTPEQVQALLALAADEIARLLVALDQASCALEQADVIRHVKDRTTIAAIPSAFALALNNALALKR